MNYSWTENELLRSLGLTANMIRKFETLLFIMESMYTGNFKFGDERDEELISGKFFKWDEKPTKKHISQIKNLGDKLVGDTVKNRRGIYNGMMIDNIKHELSENGIEFIVKEKNIEGDHTVPVSVVTSCLMDKRSKGSWKADYDGAMYLGVPKEYQYDIASILRRTSGVVLMRKEQNKEAHHKRLEIQKRDFTSHSGIVDWLGLIDALLDGVVYKELGYNFLIRRVKGRNVPQTNLINEELIKLVKSTKTIKKPKQKIKKLKTIEDFC